MAGDVKKRNLLGTPQGELEQLFAGMGEKPYRARQLLQWIYQRGVTDFDEMTDLSKSVRAQLAETATIEFARVDSQHDSADGTVKWLFASGSGQRIEAVFIPEPGRGTLCISSQVGCALDCAFCATGAQGFNRNLDASEIISQVWHANTVLPRRENGEPAVTNVVFMGMGEPLANYRNVVAAKSWVTSAMFRWRYRCTHRMMRCEMSWFPLTSCTRSTSCSMRAGAMRRNMRTASSHSST